MAQSIGFENVDKKDVRNLLNAKDAGFSEEDLEKFVINKDKGNS